MVPEAARIFQGWHSLPAYRVWCFRWLLCDQLKAATRFAIMSVQCGHLRYSKPSSGVLLIKLFASVLTFLLICHYLQAEAGQALGLSGADVAQIAAERRLQAQQRFMAGWLKLQNEVNALIDSTAADNTDQSVSSLGFMKGCCDLKRCQSVVACVRRSCLAVQPPS